MPRVTKVYYVLVLPDGAVSRTGHFLKRARALQRNFLREKSEEEDNDADQLNRHQNPDVSAS